MAGRLDGVLVLPGHLSSEQALPSAVAPARIVVPEAGPHCNGGREEQTEENGGHDGVGTGVAEPHLSLGLGSEAGGLGGGRGTEACGGGAAGDSSREAADGGEHIDWSWERLW